MELELLDEMAEHYGCRPSDLACGPAEQFNFDFLIYRQARASRLRRVQRVMRGGTIKSQADALVKILNVMLAHGS